MIAIITAIRISKVLPMAYVMVYPIAGSVEPSESCIAPSDAVVTRAPALQPRLIAGGNLKILSPIQIPIIKGRAVDMMPATKSIHPTFSMP